MSVSVYILPAFVLIAFILAFIKKVNVYDAFISGVNDATALLLIIFPYICAVLIMSELFEAS
jgi:spore maturation protein SpmB